MTRVWIAQCLCPQRHAILAASGEAANEFDAEEAIAKPLRDRITYVLQSGIINPWCGVCRAKSETWHYELGRTPFRTIAEAKPHLEQSDVEQSLVRRLFGGR